MDTITLSAFKRSRPVHFYRAVFSGYCICLEPVSIVKIYYLNSLPLYYVGFFHELFVYSDASFIIQICTCYCAVMYFRLHQYAHHPNVSLSSGKLPFFTSLEKSAAAFLISSLRFM